MTPLGEKDPLQPHDNSRTHDVARVLFDSEDTRQRVSTYDHSLGRLAIIGHILADTDTVHAAFQRSLETGAVDSLAELPGSFSGVITQADKITAFGDLAGQFPLYYRNQPEGIALGASAYELAQSTGELDLATLAARICGMDMLADGHSSFKDVSRLMGGDQVCITASGLRIEPYKKLTPDPSFKVADSIAATRDSITEAIQGRATHQLSTDFSGGIDSTSLGFAAATISGRDLPAFVNYSQNYPAGDIAYARRFAALDPRIKLHELRTTDVMLPYSNLASSDIPFYPDEPYRGVAIIGRERARQRFIGEELQSTIHLNGVGGDALYDGMPYVADLLRSGKPERAARTAVILGRTYLKDPGVLMERARRQAETTLPQAFEFLAEALADPSQTEAFDTGWLPRLGEAAGWLTLAAREALAERALEVAEQKMPESIGIGDYNLINQIRDSGDAQRHQRSLMGGEDFELHAPFLDSNVIMAATNLDAEDRNQAGRFKFILQEALGGHLVPEQMYEQRQGKGNYSAEMYEGVRRAMPDILAMLQDSRLASLGVIEPNAVRRTLDTLDTATTFPFGGLAHLVATEIWLRQRNALNDATQPFVTATDSFKNSATIPQIAELSAQSMGILSRTYALSEGLSFAPGPDQLVIFDRLTEELVIGNSTTGYVLRALNETGDPNMVIRQLAQTYPHVPESRLQSDVAGLLRSMHERGFLVEDAQAIPRDIPTWSTPSTDSDSTIGETMRVRTLLPEEMFELSERERKMGEATLGKVFELKKGSFNDTTKLLEQLRGQNTRDASEQEARRNLVIAHRVSGSLGRVACYELSLTAVLLGATQGVSTDWVVGTAFNPPRFHAWPEVRGIPIVTGADEPVAGVYQSWLRS